MAKTLEANLTEGSVSRQLYVMAVPMVWGLLATMSFNIVDTFFVAQLGNKPLAAMSFTFPVIMVLMSLSIGLGAGTSSAVARAIGEGNALRAQRLATDATSLAFLVAVLMSVMGWLTIDPLFTALGATPDLLPLIREYMTIWYISAPCLMVPMVSLAALRALGKSHIQGYLMGAGALLNAVLDPILIFGLLGAPALGLQGAALATLITRTIILLLALYWLCIREQVLINPWAPWEILRDTWSRVVEVGVPAMLANVIIPIASGIVLMMVAGYGTDAVAGLGIAVRLEPLMLIVFYALSGAVGPFFGQNLGAGKPERIREALRVLTFFSLVLGILLALFLWFLGDVVAGFFSRDPDVLNVAVVYLSIVPFSYAAYGLIMSVNAAFNGLGKPWPALFLSMARVGFVFLPLAFAGQWLLGWIGIFAASACANVLVGVWAWWWLRQYLKRTPVPNVAP